MSRAPTLPDLNRRALIAGAAATLLPRAVAADEALYDPVPPPDSVFVRLIAATRPAALQVGPASFSAETPGILPYQVLKGGTWAVRGDDLTAELQLVPGASYTLALTDRAPGYVLFRDEIVEDPRKCGLMLYNLAVEPARLFVPRPEKEVIILEGVGPNGHKTRAVNAITVDLAVGAGGTEVARFPEVKLRRRSHITFVLAGAEGALTALSAENANS